MRLSCPCCGANMSLDALIGTEAARESVLLALQLPAPLGKLLVQYLGLFRPQHRILSFDRVASLLGELLPMVGEGKIKRGGKVYAAPQHYWQQALEEMLAKRDTLTLPLKSHGYLLTIIAGYADKAEARAEQQAEERKQRGEHRQREAKTIKGAAPLSLADHLKTLNPGGSNGNQA